VKVSAKGTPWHVAEGDEPLVATAIHDGHRVRDEVRELLGISDADRLREEDPFTGRWASIAGTHLIPTRSRFEVDLNRPREKAVYIEPADAWGLHVWERSPPPGLLDRSLAEYDAFYAELKRIYSGMADRFGAFVVLDFHSYNHRRGGPGAPPDDPRENPEVNIGTGTMDRNRWSRVVDRCIAEFRAFDFGGRRLDVRENVKFVGGHHVRWSHQTFPDAACAIAVEFKKFFMDEWTGKPDTRAVELIADAVRAMSAGVLEEIRAIGKRWRTRIPR
jgi:N-formylglutamate amidohydrolase